MVMESPLFEKNNEYPIFDTEVYNCRYYHFREFLTEAESHTVGNKEMLSDELRAKMMDEEFENEFGTFMFGDLEKHCDKLEKLLISGISHAGIIRTHIIIRFIMFTLHPYSMRKVEMFFAEQSGRAERHGK